MSNYNSILDLVEEVDYQNDYSYEQRVNLFNKYHISTSTKYINPIMLLTEHIRSMGSSYDGFASTTRFQGVSHCGEVKTAFNKEYSEGKSNYVEHEDFRLFTVLKVKYHFPRDRDFKQVILFKQFKEDSFINIRISNLDHFWPRRGYDIYASAREFALDLGYNLNF